LFSFYLFVILLGVLLYHFRVKYVK